MPSRKRPKTSRKLRPRCLWSTLSASGTHASTRHISLYDAGCDADDRVRLAVDHERDPSTDGAPPNRRCQQLLADDDDLVAAGAILVIEEVPARQPAAPPR